MKKPKLKTNFYKNYKFRILPHVKIDKLEWKDKWNTPRCEKEPGFYVEWLWWGFHSSRDDSQYWEQKIWIDEYHNGDLEVAKSNWKWRNIKGESTWKDYE